MSSVVSVFSDDGNDVIVVDVSGFSNEGDDVIVVDVSYSEHKMLNLMTENV